MHQRRRITGQLMLKIFKPAKILPIGILQQPIHYRFVTLAKCVFQIMQPYHQSGRKGDVQYSRQRKSQTSLQTIPTQFHPLTETWDVDDLKSDPDGSETIR